MTRHFTDKSLLNGGTEPIAHPEQPQPDLQEGTHSARRDKKGTLLLAAAAILLLLLAAAQGYVSFRAQYTFVNHAKRTHVPSILEALGLDTGAVIFALLALALACRGGRAVAERVLNVACASGSLIMNLLAADLTSPRSVTVWVLPSALYALTSDRLIAVIQRWAQTTNPSTRPAQEESAWQALGGLGLWTLRLILDTPGTVKGFRRWVLSAAPVTPGIRSSTPPASRVLHPAHPKSAIEPPRDPGHGSQHPLADHEERGPSPDGSGTDALASGETKRAALIRLYERCGEQGDPRYGDRAKTAALAGEIANRIGYHPGTARRELARYLDAQAQPGQPAAQEVAS